MSVIIVLYYVDKSRAILYPSFFLRRAINLKANRWKRTTKWRKCHAINRCHVRYVTDREGNSTGILCCTRTNWICESDATVTIFHRYWHRLICHVFSWTQSRANVKYYVQRIWLTIVCNLRCWREQAAWLRFTLFSLSLFLSFSIYLFIYLSSSPSLSLCLMYIYDAFIISVHN